MKKLTLLLSLISASASINAQTIKGKVIDTESAPIGYANVILYELPDTTYIAGVITNNEGRFELQAPPSEDTILEISFVGYQTQFAAALEEQTITLLEGGLTIDEVVVKGARPISKITATGVQTTVENTLLSEIGTGNDVLKRIPMVTGDDGEFEVFGRGAAKIYINNREVRDPAEIDNLNSSDIASIEVISSPGAQYDASVAAIIKIKTIKRQGDGLSLSARSTISTWQNQDYINQINTNYRTGGLDIFANIYHSDNTSFQYGDLYQITNVDDTILEQQSYIDSSFRDIALNGTLGVNYQINEQHNLGVRYDYKSKPKETTDMDLLSDVLIDGSLYDTWNNNEYKAYTTTPTSQVNLYYAGEVGKLSIDFNTDYMYSGISSDNVNTELSEIGGENIINSSSEIDNRLLATKLQLNYPVLEGQLSVGSEYVDIERSDDYISDLEGYSSSTDIAEQNLALFAQWQRATEIGQFSIGVRYEDATYDYLVDGVKDNDMSSSYGQWFPNASYANQFGSVGVQLSYTSKVVRPTYSELSSNMTYANSLTIQTGNPYLKPTITQSFALAGVWQNIQAQVSYTLQENAIVQWIDRWEEDEMVSIINYRNLSQMPRFVAYVAYAPTIGVWRPSFNVGMQKDWIDYSEFDIEDSESRMKEPIFFSSLNNLIELPCNFTINLDASYLSTGSSQTAYVSEDSLTIGAGVTKSLFNKALSIKLAISDITNQSQSVMILMPETTLTNTYHFDNREVSLTIRYFFNSTRSKYKGSGAGSEAKDRF